MTHPIETENLAAHVSLCEERYRALDARFTHLEHKIDDLAQVVQDIHTDLHALRDRTSDRWNTLQVSVIGVLLTITGALIAHTWL